MDDILADNCHINPDTPQPEKSATEAAVDWTKEMAGDIQSTVTNRQAMTEIAIGAAKQLKDDPKGTLKYFGIGLAVRAVGAIPAAVGYLAGREGAMLALKGPGATIDDTIKLATSLPRGAESVINASQVLSSPDSTEAQKAAANKDLELVGANIMAALVMRGGGAGPEALSVAASGVRTAAMETGPEAQAFQELTDPAAMWEKPQSPQYVAIHDVDSEGVSHHRRINPSTGHQLDYAHYPSGNEQIRITDANSNLVATYFGYPTNKALTGNVELECTFYCNNLPTSGYSVYTNGEVHGRFYDETGKPRHIESYYPYNGSTSYRELDQNGRLIITHVRNNK